jgi:hypothetical protein
MATRLQQEVEQVGDRHLRQKAEPLFQRRLAEESRALHDLAALDDPHRSGFAIKAASRSFGNTNFAASAFGVGSGTGSVARCEFQ